MNPTDSMSEIVPYGEPISLDAAKAVMQAAEAEASRENWRLVIAIVDSGCNIIMLHRMDDAQLGSIMLAQQKGRDCGYDSAVRRARFRIHWKRSRFG